MPAVEVCSLSRWPGRFALAVLVLAFGGVTRIAVADTALPPAPAFHGVAWAAPAACPSVDGVRARIERRLGHPLDAELAPGGAIDISISRVGGRFVARLGVGDEVRTLTAARCDELADAVAVVVVRLVRDGALAASPAVHAVATWPAAPSSAAKSVAIAAEPDVEASAPADPIEPDAPRRWGLGMRIAGVSGIGIIPQVGLGAEVALTGHRDWLMGEISATKWLASGEPVKGDPGAQVNVDLKVIAMRVGWMAPKLPLRAWLGAETGTMSGGGTGVAYAESGSGRWAAIGAGFGVAWRMTTWARLVGTTEVLGAFERVKFNLSDGTSVYEPTPVSARTTLGIEVGWQ